MGRNPAPQPILGLGTQITDLPVITHPVLRFTVTFKHLHMMHKPGRLLQVSDLISHQTTSGKSLISKEGLTTGQLNSCNRAITYVKKIPWPHLLKVEGATGTPASGSLKQPLLKLHSCSLYFI
jgi:hypothetical protein